LTNETALSHIFIEKHGILFNWNTQRSSTCIYELWIQSYKVLILWWSWWGKGAGC